jgi:hypothetical protein
MSSQILRLTKNHSADYFYRYFLAADPIRNSRLSVCYPINDDDPMDDVSSMACFINCIEPYRSFLPITD